METINHECYVSLEVAKLLKKVGFDWECRCYYETSGKLRGKNSGSFSNHNSPLIWQNNGNTDTQLYSAPTFDVVQRWLRENKDFDINILTDFDSVKRLYYVRYIVKDGHYKTYYITNNQSYVYFNTYEEAQEAGIKKALEMILEKGE